jgi:signal transduction histidine kinase
MVAPAFVVAHYLLFVGVLCVSSALCYWTFRNRQKWAAAEYAAFSASLVVWSLVVIAGLALPFAYAEEINMLLRVIRAVMSVLFLLFCLTYVGGRERLGELGWAAFGVLSAGLLAIAVLPPLVLEGQGTIVSRGAIPAVLYVHPVTTPVFTTVGYATSGLGGLLVLYKVSRTGYANISQTAVMLFAITVPVLFDSIFYELLSPVPGVDYTVVFTTMSASVFVVGLYRYDLFGFVPIARENAVSAMADAVIVLNPDRRVVDYNDGAESLAVGDLEHGAAAASVLPAALVESAAVADATPGHESLTATVEGEECRLEVDADVLQNVRDLAAIVLVVRDVTEVERYAEDLERQTERLEQVASVVSHDLRNPLGVAQGFLELADEQADLEEHDRVSEALGRMDVIIEDALTLAREGTAVENPAWCRLGPAAEAAWGSTATADATLDVEADAGVEVMADGGRLRTVLENLFRNSADHGPEDVTVRIGALDAGDDSTPAGFYVEDTGPGIPAEEREQVLEQGYTTDSEGTGFGLAIVETVAEAHDWTVTVTESPEGGARFEFREAEVRLPD